MGHKNLIFILIDSLRPDYLSCYGYDKSETINIDNLAQNGCIFNNAFTVSTVTPVVFSTLLTGVYPFQHGVREFSYVMSDRFTTLGEIFKKNDYKTGAIIGSFVLDKTRGFDRGFDYYNDVFETQGFYNDRKIISDTQNEVIFRWGEVITDLAIKWIKKNKDNKFMLFLHFWDVHLPYSPPKRFIRKESQEYVGIINGSVKQAEEFNKGNLELKESDINQFKELYEGGVKNIDDCIGKIINVINNNNLNSNTSIIFTSDHGESLGEHEYIGHGRTLYESIIRIPLIISGPMAKDVKEKKVNCLVSNGDIFPTIINRFKFKMPENVIGKNILDILKDQSTKEQKIKDFIYSETYFPKYFENKRIVYRTNEWKLIREPEKIIENKSIKNIFVLFKMFCYRFWKNKKYRIFLLQKFWDNFIIRKQKNLYTKIEEKLKKQRNSKRELYNIKNDPGETVNLYEIEQDISKSLENSLNKFLHQKRHKIGAKQSQDDDTIKKLKSLGYM
ncbi:sulfatase [Patescibacteria group bacterium AH-259-L05]|nr:sulfatase [Patescibacteria group bacterium AH-259-L05]